MPWGCYGTTKKDKGEKKKINHKIYLLKRSFIFYHLSNSCYVEDFSLFFKMEKRRQREDYFLSQDPTASQLLNHKYHPSLPTFPWLESFPDKYN